jgi:hypothetical protein
MPTTLVSIFKGKIPSYLSYPLRSSDISLHIASHTKTYSFEFCFFSSFAPKPNHKDSLPYEVCTLRFSIRLPTENNDGGPLWELNVRPVLRNHRKLISDLFVNEGFQKLEGWLTTPRTPLWLSTSGHSLKIQYSPGNRSFIYTEWR